MNVSVVITCLNEEENIECCVESLISQNYFKGMYEIIIVDGGSTDNTQNIINKLGIKNELIRLVVELKKGTAAGRNAGIRIARYDHIAFIDADCEAPQDWLDTLVLHFEAAFQKNRNIVAVGGKNLPPEDAPHFVQAIGIALDSYLGSFNSAQGRQFEKTVYVNSLATLNALYDKQKMIDIGLFDESLGSEAEDAEMNYRLYTSGGRFLFIPASFVWHKMRPTPKTWFKNMFRYGKGRARLLKRYPRMWAASYVLPLLFAIAITSIVLFPFSKIFLLPVLYLPLLLVYSLLHCVKKRKTAFVLDVALVYMIQHFGYAAGEIFGLFKKTIK